MINMKYTVILNQLIRKSNCEPQYSSLKAAKEAIYKELDERIKVLQKYKRAVRKLKGSDV